jgi:hypothetical protein
LGEDFGIAAFIISVVLALIRIWEAFFQRAQFKVETKWLWGEGAEGAYLNISNVGHASGGIRGLWFRGTSEGKWRPSRYETGLFPCFLAKDQALPSIFYEAKELQDEDGTLASHIVLELSSGKEKAFKLPPPGEGD